jgi:intracellular multiplication protein IcmK
MTGFSISIRMRFAVLLVMPLAFQTGHAQPARAVAAASSSAQWSQSPAVTVVAQPPKLQANFPPSNFAAGNYPVPQPQVAANPATVATGPHDGMAPLLPLAPPPTDYQRAAEIVSPLQDGAIRQLRGRFDSSRNAKAHKPMRTSPRIRSTSVDLSPGASLPILRTMPGETSTVVFLDSTGAPWPLAAIPRISKPSVASIEWLKDTPAVLVSMLSPYEEANMTVFLHGLPMPVVVKLSAGEPSGGHRWREVDYRLDLRIPGRGPYAKAAIAGSPKIALYDDTLQAFLDGLPPQTAVRLKPRGSTPGRTVVWQHDGALFVRTDRDMQNAFDSTLAASDGTRVYRLPLTPFLTLSDAGKAVTFQVDIR